MFCTSPCCTKFDEINTLESNLNNAQQELLNDSNSWHNTFYAVITSCVKVESLQNKVKK